MPTGRNELAVASSGTKLFAVGGYGNNYGIYSNNYGFDTLEIYESATDSWSAAAPMPTARMDLAAAIVGNTLFALGGYGGAIAYLRGDHYLNVVEAYGIEGGIWSAAEPIATQRYGLAAVAGP